METPDVVQRYLEIKKRLEPQNRNASTDAWNSIRISAALLVIAEIIADEVYKNA